MSNITFIPNSLRTRRMAAGLLQKDVAQLLGLDCADRISHWENGTAMPNVVNLFKLAAIYQVLPHELYPNLFQLVKEMGQEEQQASEQLKRAPVSRRP